MDKEIENVEVAPDEKIKEVTENEQSESDNKMSDKEIWEACEQENVDYQPVDMDLKTGIQLVLAAADAVKNFADAKDQAEQDANVASKAVLVIQACVALLHFYKLKPAVVFDILETSGIDFPANMRFERQVVEVISRESGCQVSSGTKSKFAGCLSLLITEDIPTEDVSNFIAKIGGWTKLYNLYRKKVEAPQKKEEQRLKKLEDANTIRHLETETQPIGNVMADKPDDTEIRDQFDGFDSSLSIMVVRRTDDGVLEVLGRLAADETKAEQLICQYGLFVPAVTADNDNNADEEKCNANT